VENILRSGGTRAAQIATINDTLWPVLRACIDAGDLTGAADAWSDAMEMRDETYFARERGEALMVPTSPDMHDELVEGEGYAGVATAVMLASSQRRKVPLILNVPNRGAIHGLGDDDVVEVTCMMDEHGAHPLAQGEIPDSARALLAQVKLYERLTVRAAVEGSYDTALEALLAHPMVGSYPLARSILDDYLAAHATYLSLV
jgi:6-phospho-beta-glucosidase